MLIVDFLRIIAPGLGDNEYAFRADRLIEFEREFVNIYPQPEELRDLMYEKVEESIPQFQARYPNPVDGRADEGGASRTKGF